MAQSGSETEYTRLDFSRLPRYKIEKGQLVPNPTSTLDPAPENKHRSCKIQTNPNFVMKKPFCKFCYNRRRPASEFKSHFTKAGPEFGAKIVCPLLLSQQCARCGEIGHTPVMCQSKVWLCCDPNFGENGIDYYMGSLETPDMWQHPIPPALQAKHAQWEKENVITSRVWIMMSGDHRQYTNDCFICYGGPNWVSFDTKPKTAYEKMVEMKYSWLRRVLPAQPNKKTDAICSTTTSSPSCGESIPVASKSNQEQSTQPKPIAHARDLSRNEIRQIISKYCVPKTDATTASV